MIRHSFALAAFTASLSTGAFAHDEVRSGEFSGRSEHVNTGGVTLSKHESGYTVELGKNFFLDGAPDPKVGFGINGEYIDGTLIGVLESNTGAQTYRVPAHLNAEVFTEVFIWCEKFGVPLGVATLK